MCREVVGLAVVAALACAAPAAADTVPAGATWHEEYLRSRDGTRLHVDVLRPVRLAPGGRTPVALLVSPYLGTLEPGNSGGLPVGQPYRPGPRIPPYERDLIAGALRRGYTVAGVTLRGFGASGGCNDWGGPGEQGDAVAAVEWAGRRSWSDGRVGTFGISYEGWTQVMALAGRAAGLRAAVAMAPPVNGYGTMYMNGNRYVSAGYELPFYYEWLALLPPNLAASPAAHANALTALAANPDCPARKIPQADADPDRAYWRARDLRRRLRGARVPVLWTQGFLDANVKPDALLPGYGALRGPKHAWLGQFTHWPPSGIDRGGAAFTGRPGFTAEALDWLDAYVKRDGAALARVRSAPRVVVQDGDGRWRAERSWPPRDTRAFVMPLRAGTYVDQGGNEADRKRTDCSAAIGADPACAPQEQNGVGSWTFTRPLRVPVRMAGAPRVALDLRTRAAGVNAIALLYDVSPRGTASLVTRGASVVRRSGRVAFDLYPQDWRVRPGHRFGLLLSGSDDWWYTPGSSLTRVDVLGGRASLPLLACRRTRFLPGRASHDMRYRGPFPVAASTIARRTARVAPRAAKCRRSSRAADPGGIGSGADGDGRPGDDASVDRRARR